MTGPQTLTLSLAARVNALPTPTEPQANPSVAPSVVRAAFEALDAGHTHYTDRPGILPLRKRIVDSLNERYQLGMQPDQITITCGATEAYFVTLKQLVKPDASILCIGSGDAIQGAARLIGASLTKNADAGNISLVYLSPADPQNKINALLERVIANNWWALWDMAAGPLTDFHPAQQPDLAPRIISVGSFSGELPGWRVGWMGGSQMANKLRAYKQSMTICTTSVAQWAALGLEDVL
jgi:aspartate/methionine/tyrosine aminotransferase